MFSNKKQDQLIRWLCPSASKYDIAVRYFQGVPGISLLRSVFYLMNCHCAVNFC